MSEQFEDIIKPNQILNNHLYTVNQYDRYQDNMFESNMFNNNINKMEKNICRNSVDDGFFRSDDNNNYIGFQSKNKKTKTVKNKSRVQKSSINSDILKRDNMISNNNLFKYYKDIIP